MLKFVLLAVGSLAVVRGADSDVAPAAGKMLRANAQIHIVANLEKSIAFYRDAVGLEIKSPIAPLTDSAFLQAIAAVSPKVRARTASFTIPGSEMEFKLLEFSGVERKTVQQRLYDPGVVRFSISVRDLDAAFAQVKARGIPVMTAGGAPVSTQQPRNKTRAVMMKDPDGFVFEFVQADPEPPAAASSRSNIYNARASLVVEDIEKSLTLYRDILGFKAREPNVVNEAVLALEGTPAAVARTSATNPPNATNFWVVWEFTKIERRTLATRVQDPGSPALSLWVENLPALLTSLRAAGIHVETPGGDAVRLGPALRGVLVRSPDGLLIELIEKT